MQAGGGSGVTKFGLRGHMINHGFAPNDFIERMVNERTKKLKIHDGSPLILLPLGFIKCKHVAVVVV